MMRLTVVCSVLLTVPCLAFAQEESDDTQHQIIVDDLRVIESRHDYATTVQRIKDTLSNHETMRLLNDMDLAEAAEGSGVALAPTHLFVFANPQLGSRLMKENATVGLDLPHQLVVYESDDKTYVAFSTAEYIGARHALEGMEETLSDLDHALERIALTATDREEVVPQPDAMDMSNDRGILTAEALGDVAQAAARLEQTLKNDENITYVEVMDPMEAAKQAGVEMPPLRLIIAGQAKREVEMVRLSPTAAVDLPLKFLVFQDAENNKTYIAWNDPEYIALRHDIDKNEELLQQMAGYQQSTAESAAQMEQAKSTN